MRMFLSMIVHYTRVLDHGHTYGHHYQFEGYAPILYRRIIDKRVNSPYNNANSHSRRRFRWKCILYYF